MEDGERRLRRNTQRLLKGLPLFSVVFVFLTGRQIWRVNEVLDCRADRFLLVCAPV